MSTMPFPPPSPPAAISLERSRLVPAAPEVVWPIVSDAGGYADYVRGLSHSEIVEGSGEGMRRRCYDTRGRGWNETCTAWDPGCGYVMEVDTAS